MKKETVKKYENFLAACRKKSVILNIRQLAKDHSVSVTFTDWLIKNRYLVKLAGGSYKYLGNNNKRDVIVHMYGYRNEPKHPKQEPAGFAYPISVRCEQTDDREKCIKLLEQIGYIYKGIKDKNHRSVVTNYAGKTARMSCFMFKNDYDFGRYNVDHFDANLIRDIASVRTGDVWVKGEPFVSKLTHGYGFDQIGKSAGLKITKTNLRRPTISEICDHHGYELNGMNIVKKSEPKPDKTVVIEHNPVASNPIVSSFIDDYKSTVSVKTLEEREAAAILFLKEIEADHGVSYSLTRIETIKTKLL